MIDVIGAIDVIGVIDVIDVIGVIGVINVIQLSQNIILWTQFYCCSIFCCNLSVLVMPIKKIFTF